MDALIALFGSYAKVKILRLFLFNETAVFSIKEIGMQTKCDPKSVRKELASLIKADILKKKVAVKEVIIARGKTASDKSKIHGYALNEKFPYCDPLKNLLTVTSIQADESLAKRLSGAGRVKLVMAAGVFIQNWDSRVDLLVVGDELNLRKIESIISAIEADIGKEISYSAFETSDFEYRLGIHDRLIRDILDFPHTILIDRLGIEP